VKLSPDAIEEIVSLARNYLAGTVSENDVRAWESGREFAQALVQLSEGCLVGVPCERHSEMVHGKEAEELRSGVEQILANTADVDDDDASHVLREMRKSLLFLLDHIDARDSLAFREAQPSSPNASAI
jgi:hypothetical protein